MKEFAGPMGSIDPASGISPSGPLFPITSGGGSDRYQLGLLLKVFLLEAASFFFSSAREPGLTPFVISEKQRIVYKTRTLTLLVRVGIV
ncbi:hypothetical protein [Emcibacter nanhaiensis]|uniref:Uncharacterized protein n=1 Tax=Emcibacter nanhaiensis TaxID=1505037 RepID=A0A501PNR1_9PROT|nr:hypothetical protein [Emcibacter nanhaiensis]TPD61757.1 hypothetical protein FIV46_05995 [Emcibacter nanhaiensis]